MYKKILKTPQKCDDQYILTKMLNKVRDKDLLTIDARYHGTKVCYLGMCVIVKRKNCCFLQI